MARHGPGWSQAVLAHRLSNKRDLPSLPLGRKQIGRLRDRQARRPVLEPFDSHQQVRLQVLRDLHRLRVIDRRSTVHVEPKYPVRIALRELTWRMQGRPSNRGSSGRCGFGPGTLWRRKSCVLDSQHHVTRIKARSTRSSRASFGGYCAPVAPATRFWHLAEHGEVGSKTDRELLRSEIVGSLVDHPARNPRESPCRKTRMSLRPMNTASGSTCRAWDHRLPEAYKDLGGKSDEISRSHGFFVYVYGRWLNVVDGHFGISPNELSNGTFGFRLVVHMDGLDDGLAARKRYGEGPRSRPAQDVSGRSSTGAVCDRDAFLR